MTVEKTISTVEVGPLSFAVRYVDQDGRRDETNRAPDQGPSVQVLSKVSGTDRQLLRFDCFDRYPHYHYDPEGVNKRVGIDTVAGGSALGWSLQQLRTRLPQMLQAAGHEDVADTVASLPGLASAIDEVSSSARDAALKWRRTVTHNGSAELREIPGAEVIEAGNIRFGLEFRELPQISARGMAIHVLSDVAGQEIELLAFDCFDKNAHYHYGPRNKDLRHYWDTAVVPDPLRWVLDRFKEGSLPKMIERAGYPGIAAELDTALIGSLLESRIEPRALAIREANVGDS